ncbi:hypothetical protein C8F01DRAFT_1004520 [Mycena amicta]|nr:hypothetical protein C8F01DRAFT_1004520 [Mycena amicta]
MNVQPEDVIGLIYLTSSILSCPPPDQPRELNLGIIIIDRYRCKGYAREAVDLVLAEAFENHNVHRIQATLIDGSTKDRMTSILTQAWFSHEGTARSAFYHPLLAEWQDITRFGIIDTQWVMRRFWKPAPKTIWDELFMRHERERTELLRWEEMTGKVKRSTSMETLRAAPPPPDSVVDFTMSESESVSGDRDRDKGKAIDIEKWSQSVSLRRQERWMHGADSDADSVVADDHDAALAFDMAGSARLHRQPPSDSRSESGSVVSVPRSESVVSGPSSSDSWDDMMYDEESACEWENRSDED